MRDEDYYNSQIRWLTSYADKIEDKETSDHLSTIVIDIKTLVAKCKGQEDVIKSLLKKGEDDGK